MYSIEEVEIEVFFILLNKWSPHQNTLEMLESSWRKYWRIFVFHSNSDNEESSEYLFQQYHNCRLDLIYLESYAYIYEIKGNVNLSRSFAISFKPVGLWHWKVLFAKGLMKPNMFSWKSVRFSEFLILESKLFHSITVVPKASFLYPVKRCFQRVEKGCTGNQWVNIKQRNTVFMSCHICLSSSWY